MKPTIYFLISYLTIHSAYSQNINGLIQSSENGVSVVGAHILNITQNTIAISSELGNFYVEGEIGDTLIVSNINFITKHFIVKTKNRISILLKPNLIQLEEVIVSNLPKTANDFRKKLIALPMQENGKMVPFGVTPGKLMPNIPVIYDSEEINSVGYAIRNPLRFAASKVNPKFQEKVKYWEIQSDSDNSIIRNKKYNRELLASLTGLEGDDLTDFINYMNLSDSYINKSSDYEIAERVKEEFEGYQILNQGK